MQLNQRRSNNGNGGGIFIDIDFAIQSQISVQSATFTLCSATKQLNTPDIRSGYGSGIFLTVNNWQSSNNGIDLSGASYINCEADQGDKGLFIVMNELQQLCRLGNPAGQYVRSNGYIDNISQKSLLMGYLGFPTTFESASTDTDLLDRISALELLWININKQCTSGSGGAISSQLSDGELNIDGSTFDTCSAKQPGNGGALSLYQQTATSVISITNSLFKDCKTLSGSSSIYGWGGGIFLFTSISSNALSSSNLLMIDLAFIGCQSIIGGHNIHIRSPNTKETGLAISSNNLLTVNGTTNLYISLSYIS
ncbi:MAG: hypothetical protein EZS28_036929, partial [Streblomastix strix]